MTALGVAVIAPFLPFIYPPAGTGKKIDIPITLDKPVDQIASGEAVKFQSPSETGFVMATGGGDNAPGKIAFGGFVAKDLAGALNVFAINCSHLGCSIAYNTPAVRFECPCHGSMFSVAGQVIHGPAAYPLSILTWHQAADPKTGKPLPNQIVVQGLQLKGVG
jgi:Rieske Fe-S protein